MTSKIYFVPSYILLTGILMISSRARAETALPPVPATAMTQRHTTMAPTIEANKGVAEETPNQRRLRLGQAIPSYEQSFGEALETPNHRRQRLGLASVETAGE
jgi:hypothetical protein